MTKLSILIATMPARADNLAKLLSDLDVQMTYTGIEVITDNSMEYNIGTKRNKLLEMAAGEYIVFIDDDDEISKDYIATIMDAIRHNPDCIGINGLITTNNDPRSRKSWFISKQYGHWYERNGTYFRTPNHISPVKRSLALLAGFPEIEHGEDAEYSKRLLPHLKTEVIIKTPIYHYKYDNRK